MNRKYLILAFLLVAYAASSGTYTPALGQASLQPMVISPVHRDVSPPLRHISPLFFRPGSIARVLPNEPLPKARKAVQGQSMPAPIQNFDGLNNINGVLPPDTEGDIGPNHYVQWVNLSFAIYNKSGTRIYGPAAGNTLWSGFGGPCQIQNDGDPIVLYDRLADRWFFSQFALPNYPNGPFYTCIAVSTTGDPTGSYYRYAFLWSNTKMNDYPKFGVWPDGYYMTANQFNTDGSWGGAGVAVFERTQMLAGQSARMVQFDLFNVNPNFGGMLPSDLNGPTPPAGTPNFFAEIDDDIFGFPNDQLSIWQFHVDWTNTSNSTFGLNGNPNVVLPTNPFDSALCNFSSNCIPQPGTSRGLDAISDRLMYRLQYRYFGSYQTLLAKPYGEPG
jgi:hypothetical protein